MKRSIVIDPDDAMQAMLDTMRVSGRDIIFDSDGNVEKIVERVMPDDEPPTVL